MKLIYPKKFLIAIVFVAGDKPKKYSHNIQDRQYSINKFCRDMKTRWPGAEYINFYHKQSEQFKERIYLQ